MKTKYYVRVLGENTQALEEHLTRSGAHEYELLNNDLAKGILTRLYAINMEPQQATALKLSVPLEGCLDFHNALSKLQPVGNPV